MFELLHRIETTTITIGVICSIYMVFACSNNPTQPANDSPVITSLIANPVAVAVTGQSAIVCKANDPNGDALTYAWTVSSGSTAGSGDSVTWNAPSSIGVFWVKCTVSDNKGALDKDSVGIEVTVPIPTSELVAYYPFNGNANDESGNGNDGLVYGAALIADRFGIAQKAYVFDGTQSKINLGNDSLLNPTSEITISLWVNHAGGGTTNQQVILSKHGQYDTGTQSYDLAWHDSGDPRIDFYVSEDGNHMFGRSSALTLPRQPGWHHIVAVFKSNLNLDICIDGQLSNGSLFYATGDTDVQPTQTIPAHIAVTTTPAIIGSWTVNNANNFKGIVDDVRIYQRALTIDEVRSLYLEAGWTTE